MLNFLKPFTKTEVKLCPRVNGQLLKGGTPLANTLLKRKLTYDKDIVDETTTDNEGFFHFPESTQMSRRPNNPWEMVHSIAQSIWVEYAGIDHVLWLTYSPGIDFHQKLTEKLTNLVCDLNSEEFVYNFEREGSARPYHVWSIADWNDYSKKFKEE